MDVLSIFTDYAQVNNKNVQLIIEESEQLKQSISELLDWVQKNKDKLDELEKRLEKIEGK